MSIHKFTANGITLVYTLCGKGPLVVFQGVGWGPSTHLYKNSFRVLESDFTMLYFETRSGPPDKMSTKEMSTDLEHLRKHLQVEKIRVMGHSNGGAIALAYAEEFPENVEKLVLIDPELQGFSSDNFGKYLQARQGHPVYGPALQAMLERKQNPPKTEEQFSEFLKKVAPYFFTDTNKSHLMTEAMADGSVSMFNLQNQGRCDEIMKFDAVQGLGNVKAQTLILHGDDDAMCSLAAAKKAQEGIPNAKLVIIKNAGHMPWFEQPGSFFPPLKEFLME